VRERRQGHVLIHDNGGHREVRLELRNRPETHSDEKRDTRSVFSRNWITSRVIAQSPPSGDNRRFVAHRPPPTQGLRRD
jgi:hypothetical protein